MFVLGVALICPPFVVGLRPHFLLPVHQEKKTFFNGLIETPRGRERSGVRERGREVERWGTRGPVWTRRHCVAPQLCGTDSLHYSMLQQPAQSCANLLLIMLPPVSSGKSEHLLFVWFFFLQIWVKIQPVCRVSRGFLLLVLSQY